MPQLFSFDFESNTDCRSGVTDVQTFTFVHHFAGFPHIREKSANLIDPGESGEKQNKKKC